MLETLQKKLDLKSISAAILSVNFESILTIPYFRFQNDSVHVSCDYEAYYFWKILIW